MSFRNYRLPNMCLCKCLKSRISVQPSTLNMLKGPEHCWNSHDSRFIIFGHHSEKIFVGKSLS